MVNEQAVTGEKTDRSQRNVVSKSFGTVARGMGKGVTAVGRGVGTAYGTTADYAKNHPGTFCLIAFGSGVAVGILIGRSIAHRRRHWLWSVLPGASSGIGGFLLGKMFD